MRWSIVICTHNRCTELIENLPKLKSLDYPSSNYEIIIVDNASSDNTPDAAAEFGVRYVHEETIGLSQARNRGIAESKGDFIAFVDDDAWPEAHWLHALDQAFCDPKVGGAGGKILPVWKYLPRWPDWLDERLRNCFTVLDLGEAKYLCYPTYPYGTNIAFRKTLLNDVGGFNHQLGRIGNRLLSGEETELCLRIEKAGYFIRYTPNAVVHHCVHEDRMNKRWLIERFHWQGITTAIVHKKHFSKSFIFKKTCETVKNILTHFFKYLTFLIINNKKSFYYRLMLVNCFAYLKKIQK